MKMTLLVVVFLLLPSLAHALSLKLTWTDNSNNEDGFNIERRLEPGGVYGPKIASTGADVATYTDATVQTGQRYCYRVNAFNVAGVSDYSNEACATALLPPNAPSNIGITVVP